MATAKNAQKSFGPSPGVDATHVLFFDAITGGNFLFSLRMTNNPEPLTQGQNYAIAAEAITLTRTAGDAESEENARRALRGILGGTIYIALGTGASESTELSAPGRVAITLSEWTIA